MSQNAGRVTFDANIYFYSVDELDPVKHRRCDEILRAAMQARVGFVTLQALGEFAHAVVRKQVLTPKEAAQAARDWATVFEVETATIEAFELALDWWAGERLILGRPLHSHVRKSRRDRLHHRRPE